MVHETIILGAGLSGLSAAYHSGFPIYEARDRAGGTADSIRKNGFVFDIGIHILQSNAPYFLDLLNQLGVQLVNHKRRGWIYSHGCYSPYPFQVNTSHLPLTHRLRCLVGYLLRRNHSTPENYEDWMIQNFGSGFARTFLIPYAEKFWRISPRGMTYEWTGNRVPLPRVIDVIKGALRDRETSLGTHARFQYPTEPGSGFAAIAQALASRIGYIHYGMKATTIDPYKKILLFNKGERAVNYHSLITTIPLPELIKLLPDPPSDVQKAVGQLSFNSIAMVNIGVDRPHLSDKHWIHFPEKDISFFRISFPSNFCPGLNPKETTTIQAEVSYDKENPPERDELLRRVHRDLIRVGILRPEDSLSFLDVPYQKYGYVIYNRHRKDAVKKVHEYLHHLDIYPCGRYGAWEYLWSDEAVLSGKRIAEKVLSYENGRRTSAPI